MMHAGGLGFRRWCVFISGTGSNLAALLDERCDLDVALVISSRSDAYGLKRARRNGVPIHTLAKPIQWNEVHQLLLQHQIDSIFLLGFMKIVPLAFIEKWKGRILNIHPSLLPAYRGLQSIERAYNESASIGVSVHEVIPEVDAGKIILQRSVARETTLEETEFHVHRREHQMVREVALRWKVDPMLS